MESFEDRVRGTIYGLAVGATGSKTPVDLLLCSVEAYRAIGWSGAKGHLCARALVDWSRTGPANVDDTTATAVRFLAEGVPWIMAGQTAMMQGARSTSGSLVRCFPTGLARRADDDRLLVESSALSGITHAQPDSLGSCAVACLIVSALARGTLLIQALREAWLRTPWYYEGARSVLDNVLREVPTDEATGVLACLGRSLRVLAQAGDFRTGILSAANSDSALRQDAAVAGALLGARFGLSGIAQDWIDHLGNRDVLDDACDTLLEIAEESK